MEEMRADSKADTDLAWKKLYNNLSENGLLQSDVPTLISKKRNLFLFARIAALFVIVAGLTWGAFYFIGGNGPEMILASTGVFEKNVEVNLPDGSKVILNHNTRLRYPASFENGARKVELSGEAFFDIIRDQSSPFIIDAGKASIRVLGTSFNVNTSNRQEEVEVYVKSGTVMFATTDGSDSLLLEAGFMGRTTHEGAEKLPISNKNYLAWNTRVLIYEGTRLESVFNDLYSMYGIEISVKDSTIFDETITTVFEDLTEEELIKIISTSFGLTWTREDRVYVLSR
jgi:ferric-dicitrate binding protein FerR (iron transport regulator)